jgi:hypothetical protein
LQAASGTSTAIGSGATVNFNAGGTGGLAASRSGNTVTYTINLSAGNGLSFSNGTFSINAPTCGYTTGSTTYHKKLYWNGSSFICEDDKDSIAQTASASHCSWDQSSVSYLSDDEFQTESGFTSTSTSKITRIGDFINIDLLFTVPAGPPANGTIFAQVGALCRPDTSNGSGTAGSKFIDIVTRQGLVRFYENGNLQLWQGNENYYAGGTIRINGFIMAN